MTNLTTNTDISQLNKSSLETYAEEGGQNTYLFETFVPFGTGTSPVPDTNPTPSSLFTQNFTELLEVRSLDDGQTAGGLLLFFPYSGEEAFLLHFIWSVAEDRYIFDHVVKPDVALKEAFQRFRNVTAALQVLQNTIASGLFTLQGSFNAINTQDPPNVSGRPQNNPSPVLFTTLQGFASRPSSVLTLLSSAQGAICISEPATAADYQDVLTSAVLKTSTTGQIQSRAFNNITLNVAKGWNDVNLATLASGGAVEIFNSDNSGNPGFIPPNCWGHWRLEVNVGLHDASQPLPLQIALDIFVTTKNSAGEFSLNERRIDVLFNAHDPMFFCSFEAAILDEINANPLNTGPLERIQIFAVNISPDPFVACELIRCSEVTIFTYDNFGEGGRRPASIIAYDGFDVGTRLTTKAVRNNQVVPNSAQSRFTKASLRKFDTDVVDLNVTKMVMDLCPVFGLGTVFSTENYNHFITNGTFRELAMRANLLPMLGMSTKMGPVPLLTGPLTASNEVNEAAMPKWLKKIGNFFIDQAPIVGGVLGTLTGNPIGGAALGQGIKSLLDKASPQFDYAAQQWDYASPQFDSAANGPMVGGFSNFPNASVSDDDVLKILKRRPASQMDLFNRASEKQKRSTDWMFAFDRYENAEEPDDFSIDEFILANLPEDDDLVTFKDFINQASGKADPLAGLSLTLGPMDPEEVLSKVTEYARAVEVTRTDPSALDSKFLTESSPVGTRPCDSECNFVNSTLFEREHPAHPARAYEQCLRSYHSIADSTGESTLCVVYAKLALTRIPKKLARRCSREQLIDVLSVSCLAPLKENHVEYRQEINETALGKKLSKAAHAAINETYPMMLHYCLCVVLADLHLHNENWEYPYELDSKKALKKKNLDLVGRCLGAVHHYAHSLSILRHTRGLAPDANYTRAEVYAQALLFGKDYPEIHSTSVLGIGDTFPSEYGFHKIPGRMVNKGSPGNSASSSDEEDSPAAEDFSTKGPLETHDSLAPGSFLTGFVPDSSSLKDLSPLFKQRSVSVKKAVTGVRFALPAAPRESSRGYHVIMLRGNEFHGLAVTTPFSRDTRVFYGEVDGDGKWIPMKGDRLGSGRSTPLLTLSGSPNRPTLLFHDPTHEKVESYSPIISVFMIGPHVQSVAHFKVLSGKRDNAARSFTTIKLGLDGAAIDLVPAKVSGSKREKFEPYEPYPQPRPFPPVKPNTSRVTVKTLTGKAITLDLEMEADLYPIRETLGDVGADVFLPRKRLSPKGEKYFVDDAPVKATDLLGKKHPYRPAIRLSKKGSAVNNAATIAQVTKAAPSARNPGIDLAPLAKMPVSNRDRSKAISFAQTQGIPMSLALASLATKVITTPGITILDALDQAFRTAGVYFPVVGPSGNAHLAGLLFTIKPVPSWNYDGTIDADIIGTARDAVSALTPAGVYVTLLDNAPVDGGSLGLANAAFFTGNSSLAYAYTGVFANGKWVQSGDMERKALACVTLMKKMVYVGPREPKLAAFGAIDVPDPAKEISHSAPYVDGSAFTSDPRLSALRARIAALQEQVKGTKGQDTEEKRQMMQLGDELRLQKVNPAIYSFVEQMKSTSKKFSTKTQLASLAVALQKAGRNSAAANVLASANGITVVTMTDYALMNTLTAVLKAFLLHVATFKEKSDKELCTMFAAALQALTTAKPDTGALYTAHYNKFDVNMRKISPTLGQVNAMLKKLGVSPDAVKAVLDSWKVNLTMPSIKAKVVKNTKASPIDEMSSWLGADNAPAPPAPSVQPAPAPVLSPSFSFLAGTPSQQAPAPAPAPVLSLQAPTTPSPAPPDAGQVEAETITDADLQKVLAGLATLDL